MKTYSLQWRDRFATILGFYSNGEICPVLKNGAADLHNQTMTISIMVE